jgi:hypothetical protein
MMPFSGVEVVVYCSEDRWMEFRRESLPRNREFRPHRPMVRSILRPSFVGRTSKTIHRSAGRIFFGTKRDSGPPL